MDYVKETDLIAVCDRIKNAARGERGQRDLSPNGLIMCNLTAHFMVQLYRLACMLGETDSAHLCYLARTFGETLPGRIIEVCNPEPKDDDRVDAGHFILTNEAFDRLAMELQSDLEPLEAVKFARERFAQLQKRDSE